MTIRRVVLAVAALGLCLAGAAPSQASTVTPSPSTLQSGITYEFGVTMNGNDSAVYQGGVGYSSFNDGGGTGLGWNHTSNWTALNLTEAANLTVTLVRQANVGTFGDLLTPAFSIYQGWGTGPIPSGSFESHYFNPTGNLTANDPDSLWGWSVGQVSYLGHDANLGSLTSLTKMFSLAAGQYSLNFSGNPAVPGSGVQGYQATLATAPVPLPAAVWLFGSGLAGLIGFARRRMAA